MKRKSQDYSVWSVLDPSLSYNNRNKDNINKLKKQEEVTYLDYILPEYEQEITAKFMPFLSTSTPAYSSSSVHYHNKNDTFAAAANTTTTAQKERKRRTSLSVLKSRYFQHLGSPFTETETSSEDGDTIATKETDSENAILLQACLNEVENIEKELLFHRNSIFKEKLENLEKELLSIEKYQHKVIKKEDRKQEKIRDRRLKDAEAFRNAELQALDKKVQDDLDAINKDAKISEDNIRKAIASSIPSHYHSHKRLKSNQDTVNDSVTTTSSSPSSPAATSPLTSTENQTSIAIKKKISTFQAIEERKKAIYSMKEISKKVFINDDESDLENDLMKMRKKITQ